MLLYCDELRMWLKSVYHALAQEYSFAKSVSNIIVANDRIDFKLLVLAARSVESSLTISDCCCDFV